MKLNIRMLHIDCPAYVAERDVLLPEFKLVQENDSDEPLSYRLQCEGCKTRIDLGVNADLNS